MAHGLAGSAALLLFVVASAGSVLEGLLYIAVFGCGSIAGIMLIGLLLSIPVVWSFRLGRPVFLALQGLASAGSIALGLAIVYRALTGAPLS
jgi:hypothetical protein